MLHWLEKGGRGGGREDKGILFSLVELFPAVLMLISEINAFHSSNQVTHPESQQTGAQDKLN